VDLLRPHLRLLAEVFGTAVPGAPWALAGGYALQAHDLIQRPHANVDLATESAVPMPRLAESLSAALTAAGRHEVTLEDRDPLSAHLSVPDVDADTVLRLALHKETFWSAPVATPYGPALALGDAVGTKIRALYDRGLAVDLNWDRNPETFDGHVHTDLPGWLVALWNRYGFAWGGHYRNRHKDPMHFEFMGGPADADDMLAKARHELIAKGKPVPPQKNVTRKYTVAAGDNLSAIANRLHIGGGWNAIYQRNKQVIGPDPNKIRPGMVLTLP